MMRGFVGIATVSGRAEARLSHSIRHAKSMGFSTCLHADGLAVLVSDGLPALSMNETQGVIIGDIFRRKVSAGAPAHDRTTPDDLSRAVNDDRLQHDFWGDFVAIYRSEDGSLRFLHSSCGSINLYYLACDDILFIASDSDILLAMAGRRRSLNWAAIAHNLLWDDVSSSETCIDNVHEVRCGEAGHWHGNGVSVGTVWDPWRYTEAEGSVSTSEEAVELVRYEILRSIGARRGIVGRVAIDLSGGLDSSIIAAACVMCGMEAMCINLFDPDTEGDERQFARRVADRLQLKLIESSPNAEDVDLDWCARGHLPRPYVRSFVQAFDRSTLQAASNFDATSFMNGGGGDSVFCHLQSSGPVADVLKSGRRAPSAIRIAHEVSRAAQCSFWEVVRKAVQKVVRGNKHDQLMTNDQFLSAECMALAETVSSNLPRPRKQPLPGKVEQVHGIFRALYNLNGFSRSDNMRGIFPLLSQPLVEACLRIPTWLSVGEGRNRLIARLAMESELPPMAVWRTSKGGLGGLQREIIRTKSEHIRRMLLDGRLSSQGFIDRSAVEQELKDETSYRVENVYRLMRLCDIEAWCSA